MRRHYLGQNSPLGETLSRYREFFALFDDLGGYIEFFLLQDLVSATGTEIDFFMPFDHFSSPSTPADADAYREYRRRSVEFIHARNRRIDRYAANPDPFA